jgi:hypothetical protein
MSEEYYDNDSSGGGGGGGGFGGYPGDSNSMGSGLMEAEDLKIENTICSALFKSWFMSWFGFHTTLDLPTLFSFTMPSLFSGFNIPNGLFNCPNVGFLGISALFNNQPPPPVRNNDQMALSGAIVQTTNGGPIGR